MDNSDGLGRTGVWQEPIRWHSGPEERRLAKAFHNYIRQAFAYDDAARIVTGSSAGLLLYYSLLNLAKAELLVTVPHRIVGTSIKHGLSFNPQRSTSTASDAITVQDGDLRSSYESERDSSCRRELGCR